MLFISPRTAPAIKRARQVREPRPAWPREVLSQQGIRQGRVCAEGRYGQAAFGLARAVCAAQKFIARQKAMGHAL